MKSCDLRLFGRLRPDLHVQRVETPLSNTLFASLDQRLSHQGLTLTQLAASFAPSLSNGIRGQKEGVMDFSALSQLLLSLAPSLTPQDLSYFTALFDLDGDGWISPDDIMDAFEEAGTTLASLQTAAHQVHARAFKLLSKLSGVVLLDDHLSSLMYRLFLEYDTSGSILDQGRSGSKGSSLSLVDLARFLVHVSQLHLQQSQTLDFLSPHPPHPSSASPMRGGATNRRGREAEEGAKEKMKREYAVHADDIGASLIFLHAHSNSNLASSRSKSIQGRHSIMWEEFVTVLQGLAASLPTQVPQSYSSPTRHSQSPFTLSRGGVNSLALDLGQTWIPGSSPNPGLGLGGGFGIDGELGSTLTGYGVKAEAAREGEVGLHGHGPAFLSHPTADALASAMAAIGSEPLRPSAADSSRGLQYPSPASGGALSNMSQVELVAYESPFPLPGLMAHQGGLMAHQGKGEGLIMDPATGFIFRAPSSDLLNSKSNSNSNHPYPDLLGKVHNQSSSHQHRSFTPFKPFSSLIHGLFTILSSLSSDAYRLNTLYKLRDGDGKGLDTRALHSMITSEAPPGAADGISLSEVDLVMSALDSDGDGRVTLVDIQQVRDCDAMLSYHFDAP